LHDAVFVPLVVITHLVWCPERRSYQTTWMQISPSWLRPKPEGQHNTPWGEWTEMKRYISEVTSKDKKWKAPTEPLLKNRPHIAQLLTDPWWDDGTPRELCSLTVRVGLDQTQLNVNDVDNEQSITTTAGSLEEALSLLEEALAAGRNPWRKWGNGKKRK